MQNQQKKYQMKKNIVYLCAYKHLYNCSMSL